MRNEATENIATAEWSDIAPHLEEMVRKLRTSDREIFLLRFYEQKSFAEIAEMIGITEDAARKRVSRSVEALRAMLPGRCVSMPAVALGGVLGIETVKPAPAALAKATSVAASSIVATTSASLHAVGRRGTVRGSLESYLKSAGHHVRLRFIDQADQPILDALQWVEHDSAAELASMKPSAEKDAAIEKLLDSLHAQTGLTYTLEWQTLPVWFMEEVRP